jgi:hypothetical protein
VITKAGNGICLCALLRVAPSGPLTLFSLGLRAVGQQKSIALWTGVDRRRPSMLVVDQESCLAHDALRYAEICCNSDKFGVVNIRQ